MNYLRSGSEEALLWAYEIGRRAISEEIGGIDLMMKHQDVVIELLSGSRSVEECLKLAESTHRFLVESFSPYEMTFRGYREALNTVQESEERYRTLIDTARDVIYTLSTDGTIRSLNRAFETMTGWPRNEWIGKQFAPLVHPEDLPRAMDTYRRVLGGETPPTFETRILSRSGEYIIGEFTTTPAYQHDAIVGTFGIARDITERKRVQKQLEALAKRVIEVQEKERKRLARDLHDDLCQWLSGVKLSIGLLEEEMSDHQQAWMQLVKLKQQINDRIVETRRMATLLRPSALDDFGLQIALSRLFEECRKTYHIAVSFQCVELGVEHYSSDAEIAIYRIAQEALSNVVKHAKADAVSAVLKQDGQRLIFELSDNGVGMGGEHPRAEAPDGSRMGIVSMKERAELLSGMFRITSAEGRGTTIRVELPLRTERHEKD